MDFMSFADVKLIFCVFHTDSSFGFLINVSILLDMLFKSLVLSPLLAQSIDFETTKFSPLYSRCNVFSHVPQQFVVGQKVTPVDPVMVMSCH
jgi:hypothetical protein